MVTTPLSTPRTAEPGSRDVRWEVGVWTEYPAAELLDAGIRAEELGFDGYWLADVRLFRDCYSVLGALAARTTRMQLGVAVSDPFSRHPLHLAESAVTLNELAPERIVIGLGSGVAWGAAFLGRSHTQPTDTLEAAVNAMRQLTRGELCSISSAGFTVADARIGFAAPPGVPVAVVAQGPRVYELAGRTADIVIIAHYADPDGIAWAQEQIGKGSSARSEALAPVRSMLRIDVSVDRDADAARKVMLDHIGGALASGRYSRTFLAPIGLSEFADRKDKLMESDIARVGRRVMVAGGQAEVAEALARLASIPNLDAVNCRVIPTHGQSLRAAVESLAGALPTSTARG
jgi:5,10-methylenetetrahydromethanopterin reductase